jgi:hypothetical protein
MAGSWERLKYDVDAYQYGLKENEKVINYEINRPKICDVCRPPHPGYIGDMGVSISESRPLVDVESDLQNIDRINSNCPSKKYKPFCPKMESCNEGYPCGGGVVAGCFNSQEKNVDLPQCDMYPIETRTTHPICKYKSMQWDRFEALCTDPQDRGNWEHPGETLINYRLVVKDNHRPCLPTLIDQTLALPTGTGEVECQPINENACGVFTGDLRPNRFTKHPLK